MKIPNQQPASPKDVYLAQTAQTEDEDGVELSSPSQETYDEKARRRRRCYIYLVVIVFALGVTLVVISVTLFHQRGQQNASSASSLSDERPQNSNEDPTTTVVNPTRFPTSPPSKGSSFAPTVRLTQVPTAFPTLFPSDLPSNLPSTVMESTTSTFFALGDVPYDDLQASELTIQMQNIPNDADFVIHVGDLRNASESLPCKLEEFEKASSILRLSAVPVFVVLGDNDWNDCPNADEGLQYWKREFMFFESRHWNHTFNITRQEGRDETFAFRLKGTLFIGINLVGGEILDRGEWQLRLRSQSNWTADLIREYRDDIWPNTGRVVLFGHANPTNDHDDFFDPLRDFVRDELGDTLPLLYLHGDKHKWLYQENYLSQSNILRIMVTGGSSEPPLKITVNANGFLRPPDESFVYDRDLKNISLWNTLPV